MRKVDVGELVFIGNHSSLLDDAGNAVGAFSVAGVATDPTTVTVRITDGAGVTAVYTYPATVTKETTGRFYVARIPAATEAGFWYIRLEGTGAVQTAEQSRLYVRPARPAP